MSGFRLIDYFVTGDYKSGPTRKLFVDGATSNIAIGDIVSYTGDYSAADGRFVDRAIITDSNANPQFIAGIVVGFTAIDTILSNQSGLLTNEEGFVLVNTGLDMVYGATLSTALSDTTNVVGANIGFTVGASTSVTTGGVLVSGMEFDGGTLENTITLPFRVEFLNNDDPTLATIAYGRLQIAELNSTATRTPS